MPSDALEPLGEHAVGGLGDGVVAREFGALGVTRRAPWLSLILLIGFGWELHVSHASPHGPIAFALLFAAALWLRLSRPVRAPLAPGITGEVRPSPEAVPGS